MPSFIDQVVSGFDHWLHDRRVALIKRQFATCGAAFSLDLPATIRGNEHIRIGHNVSINAYVHIWGQGGLEIGDDTLIASHVSLTTLGHDVDATKFRDSLVSKPIVIGRNVWIGTHAVILPGVTIGDGAVVGAGAVVTHDVASGAVVVGVPAAPRK